MLFAIARGQSLRIGKYEEQTKEMMITIQKRIRGTQDVLSEGLMTFFERKMMAKSKGEWFLSMWYSSTLTASYSPANGAPASGSTAWCKVYVGTGMCNEKDSNAVKVVRP
jgi:hypothetical protein